MVGFSQEHAACIPLDGSLQCGTSMVRCKMACIQLESGVARFIDLPRDCVAVDVGEREDDKKKKRKRKRNALFSVSFCVEMGGNHDCCCCVYCSCFVFVGVV